MIIIWGETHLGKQNVIKEEMQCPQCNKDTILSSYTARAWFTLYFMPLIPLARFRAMLYCASCKQFYKIKPSKVPTQIAETLQEFGKALGEGDTEEIAGNIYHLLRLGAFAEADTAIDQTRQAGLARMANLTAGHAARKRSMPRVAEEYFVGILHEDPNDAEARMALGELYLGTKRRDEGIEQLRYACQLAPEALDARGTLADALVARKRWAEAREVLEEMIAIEPAVMDNKPFAKLMKKVRKKAPAPVAIEPKTPQDNPYAVG
ncbi:MAG: tetratricopeptide repeat protein [Planctomycetota bacterium]